MTKKNGKESALSLGLSKQSTNGNQMTNINLTGPELRAIHLYGCSPEPLGSYLKALGILRLVSEQKDPDALGNWHGEHFVLTTRLTKDELERFFLEEYQPTPLVAPWSGSSGFYKTNRNDFKKFLNTTDRRLERYRTVLRSIDKSIPDWWRDLMKDSKKMNSAFGRLKRHELMKSYRSLFPYELVEWLDTLISILDENQKSPLKYPPILGTGSNDGHLGFTTVFFRYLIDLIDNKKKFKHSEDLLRNCLSSKLSNNYYTTSKSKASFHFPTQVGGKNAGVGFEGSPRINPWDYILMLEGTFLFSGAISRKSGTQKYGHATAPFTVRCSRVGFGSSSNKVDEKKIKAEFWTPVWSRPAPYCELLILFREGRIELNSKQVQNGIDFARAISELGTDRGINEFYRFGLFERFGQNQLAVPLGRIRVKHKPEVDLLHDLDSWLGSIKSAIKGTKDNVPGSCLSAMRQIEKAMFNFSVHGKKENLLQVLASLGTAHQIVARTVKLHRGRPITNLRANWISEADDGSAEFRLALSLASIGRCAQKPDTPLRLHIEQLSYDANRKRWSYDKDRRPHLVWSKKRLPLNMIDILVRRLLHGKENLFGAQFCSLGDITAFIRGNTDDEKISALVKGLSLLNWDWEWYNIKETGLSLPGRPSNLKGLHSVDRSYALLKLILSPDIIKADDNKVSIPYEPRMTAKLRAKKVSDACEIARRRLHSSGLTPMGWKRSGKASRWEAAYSPIQGERLFASLLFPLYPKTYANLCKLVLRPEDVEKVASNGS